MLDIRTNGKVIFCIDWTNKVIETEYKEFKHETRDSFLVHVDLIDNDPEIVSIGTDMNEACA